MDKTLVGLMHNRGWLKRVASALVAHQPGGDPLEFVVEDAKEFADGIILVCLAVEDRSDSMPILETVDHGKQFIQC